MDDDLGLDGVSRGAGLGPWLWLLLASIAILIRRGLRRHQAPDETPTDA